MFAKGKAIFRCDVAERLSPPDYGLNPTRPDTASKMSQGIRENAI
jgi:hypothetical protein